MRPQLHATSLNTLAKCGQMFKIRYLLGHRVPPGIALVLGKGVDRAVNADLEEKIAKGELLPLDVVRDIARDSVQREWDGPEGVLLDSEDKKRGQQVVYGETVDKAIKYAETYHGAAAPSIDPLEVQAPFSIELTEFLHAADIDLELDLVGTRDVIEKNRNLRDCKTSGKFPSASAAADSIQLASYALADRVLTGKYPKKLILDFIVAGTKKDPEPRYEKREALWNPEAEEGLTDRLVNAGRLIQLYNSGIDAFTPARPEDWWCTQRWCGYYGTKLCQFWKRPVTIAPPEKPKEEGKDGSKKAAKTKGGKPRKARAKKAADSEARSAGDQGVPQPENSKRADGCASVPTAELAVERTDGPARP